MARQLIFEIIGDDASAERAIRRTSRSVDGLERNISRATRGAAAGSGLFRSLGRSIAFASGGFLAFASGGAFIRKTIDAALEAQVAQKQLAQQLANSGKAFADYRGEIDRTNLRLAAMAGFQNDELNASLTTILRTVPDVSRALKDNALAADLARARHISLAQAALVIAKTEAGNTTLLRRQGFQIRQNATVEEALAKVRKVVAGQAAAGTTSQEKFGAVLHDTEEIIGAGLLPTLNRYLLSGTRWLQQMDESGRLQHDVEAATRNVGTAVRDAAAAFRVARSAIEGVDKLTGSFENTLKDLAGIWLLLKVRTTAIRWGLIVTGEREVGSAAAVSAAEVSGLSGALARLSRLGPIGVAIGLSFVPKAKSSTNPAAPSNNPVAKAFGNLPIVGGVFSQANSLADKLNQILGLTPSGAKSAFTGGQNAFASGGSLNALTILQQTAPAATVTKSLESAVKRHVSLLGQFNILELKLADAQRTANTTLQRSILVAEESLLVRLRDQAKTLAKRTAFAQQAASVAAELRGLDAASVKQTTKQVAAAKKKAATADGFDVPLALQVAQARAEALGLTRTEKSVLRRIKEVAQAALKSGKLGLQGQLDAWQTIKDVNDQLKDAATTATTAFKKTSTAALVRGLGLTPDQIRAMRARLSQVGVNGTVPRAGFTGAFGVAVPVGPAVTTIHTTVTLDGNKVGESVTRHQQRRTRRNPAQKRGPNSV